jgi:hypothetical protein
MSSHPTKRLPHPKPTASQTPVAPRIWISALLPIHKKTKPPSKTTTHTDKFFPYYKDVNPIAQFII